MLKLTQDHTIFVSSRYHRSKIRLGIGFVPKDGEGRRVYAGPMVPGPWAYTYPLVMVIDNFGGTAAERAHRLEAGLEVDLEIGAEVEIDGVAYRLTDDRPFDYPTFTPID